MSIVRIGILSFAIVATLSAFLFGCKRSENQQTSTTVVMVNGGIDDSIISILGHDHRSAIMEIRGRCIGSTAIDPALNCQKPSSTSHDTISQLTDVLKNSRDLQITEGRKGVVLISVNHPARDLKAIRIHKLTLDPIEQYNATDALLAAMRAPELSAYMQSHRIELSPLLNGLRTSPGKDLPHLEAFQEDFTIEDLESRILDVFPGIVVYEECDLPNGRRLVSFQAERISSAK